MTLDAALFAKLRGDTGVALIVGAAIYPVRAPKNAATPWIRWQRISRIATRGIDRIEGLSETRVQVDCIADTYAEARGLSDAAKACLTNWQDVNAGIDDAVAVNSRDFDEQIADKSYFTSSLDFIVSHHE